MNWKRLTILLFALCMLLCTAACMDESDAISMIEAIQIAAENIENAATESAPEDGLVLVEDEEAPAEKETPAEAPEETPIPPDDTQPEEPDGTAPAEESVIDRDGWYTTKEDVALYLHTYGELPGNFITKNEARKLGWSGGGLDDYADGKSIGGDYFGNYEGILPDGDYHECDINTMHASSRGAERIIYSDDGRIYYTDDHYESFTLLYGEE